MLKTKSAIARAGLIMVFGAATAVVGGCEQEPAGDGDASASGTWSEGPYTYAEGVRPGDPKYVRCWVNVRYDGPHDPSFSTNIYDQIRGPAEVAYLRDLGDRMNHADWTDRVTVVRTGDTARATLFEQENFGGESATIEPNSEDVPISERGLDRVGSMKIEFVE